MKIYFATDHRGFELKEELITFVEAMGHEVEDLGAHKYDETDDYPDYIKKIKKLDEGEAAIILGATGQGEAITANRTKGNRAVVVYSQNEEIIRLSKEHNNANVLAIGASFVDVNEAKDIVDLWLRTEFTKDERHIRRLNKIDNG